MTKLDQQHPRLKMLMLLVFLLSKISYGQNDEKVFVLQGVVTDYRTNEKLTGVNVYIKGTTTGTVTNENGYYNFKVTTGDNILVFSFIGYKAIEKNVRLTADKNINIQLKSDEELLGEVKITAQRRFFGNMDYGRDIPTVKSEEIEKINSSNASDILHARLSGVWATKTSGAPGDQQKIRIRGQASFFSSAEPLYVIDGVPVPIVNLASLGIADLNIHDIENVTVLKDASSTALYGYQGGNGVILIDTKQTSKDKINFSYKSGLQWFNNYYDLMNTKDFLGSLDLAKQNIGSSIRSRYPEFSDSLCDHNRQSEIFQKGILHEYQLSGGGKAGNLNYYLSGNASQQTGIVKKSEYNKYTFLARANTKISRKLVIDISYRWNYQENLNNQNEYMGNATILRGIGIAPCLECTPDSLLENKDRMLYNRSHTTYSLLNSLDKPDKMFSESNLSYNYFSNAGSIMGRYQISPKLSINVVESFMTRHSNYNSDGYFYPVSSKTYSYQQKVKLQSDESVVLLNHQANIAYNNVINNHEIDLMFAHRYYADNLWWQVDSLENTLPDHYSLRNSMAGYGTKGSVIRKISSYITHISYNYGQRYYISAIANISRLKEGLFVDYYSLFPSLSLNWDVANEPFLYGNHIINEFSIYTNYGASGNYPLNGLSNNLYETVSNTFNDVTSTHPVLSQFANHNLKHENTAEFDIGLKSTFFNKRFKLNAAVYNKNISKQIIQRDIPYYYGGGKIYINLGDIKVTGFEIDTELKIIEQKHLNWVVKGNFSASHQEITTLADGEDMFFESGDLLFPDFIISENGSLGDIYGFEYLGKWTNEDEAANNALYVEEKGMKFLNADSAYRIGKQLTDDDKVVIGNSIPDFSWNFISSLQYKNLGIDFVIYSSWGMQKYNATRAATFLTGVNRKVNQFYQDSMMGIQTPQFYESSYFIDDASFIRLKTVSINYEPYKKVLGFKTRFTLSFENLFTYTKYKGFDPEATIFTDNNFSDNAMDRGAYPNPKGVYVTIEVKL